MKKESLYPLVALVIGLGFALACALVFFSRNNKTCVGWKLKMGGLLLTLTSFSAGCFESTCYIMALEQITVNEADQDRNIVAVEYQPIELTGQVQNRIDTSAAFSYTIGVRGEAPLVQEELHSLDGAFDENDEAFRFAVNSLEAGRYELVFSSGPTLDELQENPSSFWLQVDPEDTSVQE